MNGQFVVFFVYIKFKRLRCEMYVYVFVNLYVVDFAYCFFLGM